MGLPEEGMFWVALNGEEEGVAWQWEQCGEGYGSRKAWTVLGITEWCGEMEQRGR